VQNCLIRQFLHLQMADGVGVGAGLSFALLHVPWSKSEEAYSGT